MSFRGLTRKPVTWTKVRNSTDWQYWKQELNVDSSVNVKVCSECLQSFVGEVIFEDVWGNTSVFKYEIYLLI